MVFLEIQGPKTHAPTLFHTLSMLASLQLPYLAG